MQVRGAIGPTFCKTVGFKIFFVMSDKFSLGPPHFPTCVEAHGMTCFRSYAIHCKLYKIEWKDRNKKLSKYIEAAKVGTTYLQ